MFYRTYELLRNERSITFARLAVNSSRLIPPCKILFEIQQKDIHATLL